MMKQSIWRLIVSLTMVAILTGCNTHKNPTSFAAIPAPGLTISNGWRLQDQGKVPDSGEAISRVGYDSTSWYAATVPGTVLTTLVNQGVYPEPLYGENNRPDKIPESLCRTSWWYRTEITIPREFTNRRISLNLDGINYLAEVWVNGQKIGDIKGAFSRGVFDITSLAQPAEVAAIAVRIIPPPNPGTHAEKTIVAGTGPNGGVLAEDGPTFLCSIGWDWIPVIRDRNIGIWQRVFLTSSGCVEIVDPRIVTDIPLPRTDVADLTITTSLRNTTDQPQTGTLRGEIGVIKFSQPVTLQPNEIKAIGFSPQMTPQLHIKNPRLWWPNGLGEPNLYNLHLAFDIAGQKSDERNISFGIRKITDRVPGSDNLTISVNGVPVMCRGGNWGMDEGMKRIPRDRLETQIRLHQLANMNMIRNWVGQSTSEDFYDLCDRYGIMVWDEFFQPNKSDGPNPTDFDLYLANVREKVLRFRNHPSIVIWCGRNESDPAPEEIDEGIQKLMAELDPSRIYHRNSADGRGVHSGGPYHWQTPQAYYHPRPAEPFKTEIGSVAIPTLESIHEMMPKKDWETINDDWASHDLTHGAQEGRGAPLYADMITQRYGPIINLPDFVRKSQLANYEAFRAMYEARSAKMFHPYTGIITWMSNPSQPSFVWQIYSHDLEPMSTLFAVRKAAEPIHIQMTQDNFHVMVINNTPKQFDGAQASVRIINLDGTTTSLPKIRVSAPPTSATDLGAIAFPATASSVHFVQLELRDGDGQLISENFYWRANPDHPDDFTDLAQLAVANLKANITRNDSDSNCTLFVSITNTAKVPSILTHLQLRRQSSGQRVLPVYYSDNYISLLPGQSRTIRIEAALKDLKGDRPLVVLDGWNANIDSSEFAGAKIALNSDAGVDPNAPRTFSYQSATRPSR